MAEDVFLGIGWKTPVSLLNGATELSVGKRLVEESIVNILVTPKGTRFFLPEYGSRLYELLFEPNDEILEAMFRMTISESIDTWEKRVKFVDMELKNDVDRIECRIFYRILPSNEINSFIFPFYKSLKY